MQTDEMHPRCVRCANNFPIDRRDRAFYEKMSVPPPRHCPECRQQRRLAFNNEMNLYYRTCDLTGEKILSIYSSDKPYKVYKPEAWWSDAWDPLQYGRPFRPQHSFFDQFHELMLDVPRVALQTNYLLDENSDYTNYAGSNKNCYLIFHADFNRDCLYSYGLKKCESCLDCYNVFESELCNECIDCQGCYGCVRSQNCLNCTNGLLLRDCVGCRDCIGCRNLRQKQYCVFNRQLSRAEYEQFCATFDRTSRQALTQLEAQYEDRCRDLPARALRMIHCERSAGDQLRNCDNAVDCFDTADLRDGRYCYQLYNGARDCMDLYQFGLNAELVYDSSIIGYNAQNVRFSFGCTEQVSNLTYCHNCYHSHDLFGCCGLRRKEYCILNRQYSRDDYQALVPKLIETMEHFGEWGEFFPMDISAFAYNETTAQLFYPLDASAAAAQGLRWKVEEPLHKLDTVTVSAPDSWRELPEGAAPAVYRCAASAKPFRIIQTEIDLLRKIGAPPPDCCFEQRHRARLGKRNPRQVRSGRCGQCGDAIRTSAPQAGASPVFCESCYLGAVE